MNQSPVNSLSQKEERKLVLEAFHFCRYFFYAPEALDEFLLETVASKLPFRLLKEGRVGFIRWIWLRMVSQGLNNSVLQLWRQRIEAGVPNLDRDLRDFLFSLPSELRVVLVLKDIMQYEDQEILKILDIRWQVYRHRLHRGRIDLLGIHSQSEKS